MRVPDEPAVDPDDEVLGGFVATVADVQHHVLGQRVRTVGVARRTGQFQYLADLVRVQSIEAPHRHGRGHLATVSVVRRGPV
ncbi:hypothetical protein Raf01_05320 [Rugosimonospora africana]|uniref:Uncharacterized protein n=1 Tax=Rugosimonospora africana TaxID=556532 RepID=A0A8J3QJX2_9ACTN|nr:hypothetical protein Raf01_05320 [Rugosimonospora africana]